jgi:hypothetical protein
LRWNDGEGGVEARADDRHANPAVGNERVEVARVSGERRGWRFGRAGRTSKGNFVSRLFARGLALAAAALAAGTAAGQESSTRLVVPGPDPDWVEVNDNEDGRGSVDSRSIRRANGMVGYVGRIVYHAARDNGESELYHRGEIDRARRTYRIVAFDALAADGRLISAYANDEGGMPPQPINEGSPNEALMRTHCG